MSKQYWLMKSEPDEFSIEDLMQVKTEPWTGIRNYQARNFMRDDMKVGDEILFYHSNTKPPGVVGIAKVASAPYPDPLAFEQDSKYYDPKSMPDDPRWVMVDISFKKKFKTKVELDQLRDQEDLQNMKILQRGNRLSITPVTKEEFYKIVSMGC